MKRCILIPSYNEEKTIGGIIRQLKARNETVYIVDDGSTDKTSSIAASQDAMVIRHDKNMGKGASLREGFKRALKDGFDAVLIMDGDDQHEVEEIDDFVSMMDRTGAGMVIGNRMDDTASMPLIRRLTNRFMSWLISGICRQHVPDSQCGFRFIKRIVLESINLESSNFEIDSELILKAARSGFKIASVPIRTVYRNERSRINPFIDTIRFITFMARTIFKK